MNYYLMFAELLNKTIVEKTGNSSIIFGRFSNLSKEVKKKLEFSVKFPENSKIILEIERSSE